MPDKLESDLIKKVDLTKNEYIIRQKLLRNKYSIYDDEENLILKTKQKLFKIKEEFPFTDPEGNTVFQIKAEDIFDVAGDYAITTPEGEPIAILDKNWTLLTHKWKIRDPKDERLLAKIESRGAIVELLRHAPFIRILTQFIPHKYTIEDPEENQIGSIEGKLSIRDEYRIKVGDTGSSPKESIIAGAIAIDALEGN